MLLVLYAANKRMHTHNTNENRGQTTFFHKTGDRPRFFDSQSSERVINYIYA